MRRDDLNDLSAFMAIAEARSFTRAASQLGMSPSALSHAMKALETRLGVRLLARTTRSVATTEAGERLLGTLRPALADIEGGLEALGRLRARPSGTVRLTTLKHAAETALWPRLPAFLDANPDVRVEIDVDDRLTDIVASRFDAGIRFGDTVAKDMIAVRIGPDIRSAIVGSPAYFAKRRLPQVPQDLAAHDCIGYRLPTSGKVLPWDFEKDGRTLQIKAEGRLVFNDEALTLTAVLDGQGLALALADRVADHVAAGRLVGVLADWCWTTTGYHLYHLSRQPTPALAALIDVLRWRPPR